MTAYVALLRAVNVGGTTSLPMADLRALCERAGMAGVRTYIASGNVVFSSSRSEQAVQGVLEAALEAHVGRPVGIVVRTAEEMAAVLAENPFRHAAPNRTVAIFLAAPPPEDTISGATSRADEEIALGRREIYVHYPAGMGTSKLKIPAARTGTARNVNTVARLAAMAAETGA